MNGLVDQVEHQPFCLPRPGDVEVRMERYNAAVTDAEGTTIRYAHVVRCCECGNRSVDGRQVSD